eukprot:TRINITY_DN12192_c0_g1_i6.p4 TRINITY_DN12192_c0_g1~~TRINITY_DN12192_c0_g1_i6.p4  ORF type:complete len:227 (-),score=22.93 TRINITY_DN12192_c0_g1_i6:1132-1812(-)
MDRGRSLLIDDRYVTTKYSVITERMVSNKQILKSNQKFIYQIKYVKMFMLDLSLKICLDLINQRLKINTLCNYIYFIVLLSVTKGAIKMNIPLIDLKAQYKSIAKELDEATIDVLSSAAYIMGKNVTQFEKEFAEYIGVKNAISVGNGTDALIIALKALGIGQGDEVITSTFTYFASAECISAVGATPVFVDVEKDTFNINPDKIEEKITKKNKSYYTSSYFWAKC